MEKSVSVLQISCSVLSVSWRSYNTDTAPLLFTFILCKRVFWYKYEVITHTYGLHLCLVLLHLAASLALSCCMCACCWQLVTLHRAALGVTFSHWPLTSSCRCSAEYPRRPGGGAPGSPAHAAGQHAAGGGRVRSGERRRLGGCCGGGGGLGRSGGGQLGRALWLQSQAVPDQADLPHGAGEVRTGERGRRPDGTCQHHTSHFYWFWLLHTEKILFPRYHVSQ